MLMMDRCTWHLVLKINPVKKKARTKMVEEKSFLTANKMKPNDGNTEFLILSTAGHKNVFNLMT